VTCAVFVAPLRVYVIVTLSLGCFALTAAMRSSGLRILWPPNALITSPAFKPAAAAGEPLLTLPTRAPLPVVGGPTETPRYACSTFPLASSCLTTDVTGAALAYGLAVWMGGSGFIAAFVGGAVFGGLRREVGGEATLFLEETGGLLGAATFVLFGAVMLVPILDDLSAQVVLYSLLSLTLVRMVPVALAMLRSGARRPTVAFLGWFGPRGLASIVFAVILVEDANLAHESLLLNTIFLTIGLSVLLHGLTAAPLAGRYAAWFAAHPRDAAPPFESSPVPEQRPHRLATGLRHEHRDAEAGAPAAPAAAGSE